MHIYIFRQSIFSFLIPRRHTSSRSYVRISCMHNLCISRSSRYCPRELVPRLPPTIPILFFFYFLLSRPFATPSSNCPVLAVRVTLPCFLRNYSLELECQSVNGKPSNLQLATARFSNNFLFFHRIVIAYITTKEKQTNSG